MNTATRMKGEYIVSFFGMYQTFNSNIGKLTILLKKRVCYFRKHFVVTRNMKCSWQTCTWVWVEIVWQQILWRSAPSKVKLKWLHHFVNFGLHCPQNYDATCSLLKSTYTGGWMSLWRSFWCWCCTWASCDLVLFQTNVYTLLQHLSCSGLANYV